MTDIERIREYLDEPITSIRGLPWDDAMTLLVALDAASARIAALETERDVLKTALSSIMGRKSEMFDVDLLDTGRYRCRYCAQESYYYDEVRHTSNCVWTKAHQIAGGEDHAR